tara:strand:- start:4720 stop:5628 length:909 start_codon:yes stop_codon:yes gene_type:complete
MEKIGVVTVTYNSDKVLQPFLSDLFAQSFHNFNLYVIDNASEDKTLKILDDLNDNRVNQIRNHSNIGVAAANNIGIKKALEDKCSHILILNNDIEFPNSLFKDMLVSIKKENCSMMTPKIMYHSDKDIIWYAGGGFKKSNGYLPYHTGFNENIKNNNYQSLYVDYASTCCLLIKKDVFETIGYMDEKYFVYFDDTDFLFRVKKEGVHKIYYDSQITLFHKVGSLTKSLTKEFERSYRTHFFLKQNIRNHIYFLRKIGSVYSYLFCLFLFFKNNLRFLFSSRIKKDFSTFLIINKSYFQGWFL